MSAALKAHVRQGRLARDVDPEDDEFLQRVLQERLDETGPMVSGEEFLRNLERARREALASE